MKRALRLFRYDLPLHFVLLFTNWLPDNVMFMRFRGWMVSFFLGSCGKDFRVGRNVVLYNSSRIFIGNHVYIAYGNWLCAGETISIEDEVMVGPYSIIVSGNHMRVNRSFRYGPSDQRPIRIGKGAWIGANCSILSGADIGYGSLIGANSVVGSVVPDDVAFVGPKGGVIKRFDE